MPPPQTHVCPAPHAHTSTNSHTLPQPAATIPLGIGELDGWQDSKWVSPPLFPSWQLLWTLKAVLQNRDLESRAPCKVNHHRAFHHSHKSPHGPDSVGGLWSQTALHGSARPRFEFLASPAKLTRYLTFPNLSFCAMVMKIAVCYLQGCKQIK